MTKRFIAIAGAFIAIAASSSAWAQMPDTKSGAQPPQQLVQRAKSGPLAFGFVSTDGSVQSGSGNFTASDNSNSYEIKIQGVNYFYSSFATIVTPSLPGISYCTTGSAGGKLTVQCFNAAGESVPAAFGFTTF